MTLLSYLKEEGLKQHHVAVGARWATAAGVTGGTPAAMDWKSTQTVPVDAAARAAVMDAVHRELMADMDSDVLAGTGAPVDYTPDNFPVAQKHTDCHFGMTNPLRAPNTPETARLVAEGIRKVCENVGRLDLA